MSGHSKWHNIQARKGKQDARRSNMFTKFAKLISLAAQQGGGDPTMNFSLRLAIEKSKAAGMPKDNIERAIKRGTGADSEGVRMEEVLYEAFGPQGTAILIKAVTDNKNRTLSDVKHILSENGGNFGSSGSVKWMFELKGVVLVENDQVGNQKLSSDDFEMKMIDSGADDILKIEEGKTEIRTKVENFQKILSVLREMKIDPLDSGLQWIPKEPISVGDETENKLGKLFSAFEDNDDVDDYFTNAV